MMANISFLLKEPRVWIFMILIIGSVIAIAPWKAYASEGVEITSVSDASPARGKLAAGMIISEINGQAVGSKADYERLTTGFDGFAKVIADGLPESFWVEGGDFGITVKNLPESNVNLGIDLVGGTRILLAPQGNVTEEQVEESLAALQTRMNIYGLSDITFRIIRDISGMPYIQIEMAGTDPEQVKTLLERQGKFEAKIWRSADFTDGAASLEIGSETYNITRDGDSLIIADRRISQNSTFELGGVQMVRLPKEDIEKYTAFDISEGVSDADRSLMPAGNDTEVFLATVYTGNDIVFVYTDAQHSSLRKSGSGYSFWFTVSISQEGAQRFADAIKPVEIYVDQTGEAHVRSRIYYFIDDKITSSLGIGSGLSTGIHTETSIQGGEPTAEKSVSEMRRLQSILRSGSLPVSWERVKTDTVSPALGMGFASSALIAALSAILAVTVVIFIRYRDIRVSVPMFLTMCSELIIILGFASFIHWTIDLAAIAGIIATIGTGVDHQIIIADEIKSGLIERVFSWKQKFKRAFSIIFAAAATTIGAMLPLMFIGAGTVLSGFAITTIIGVSVGVFVTRPVYAKVLERLL